MSFDSLIIVFRALVHLAGNSFLCDRVGNVGDDRGRRNSCALRSKAAWKVNHPFAFRVRIAVNTSFNTSRAPLLLSRSEVLSLPPSLFFFSPYRTVNVRASEIIIRRRVSPCLLISSVFN